MQNNSKLIVSILAVFAVLSSALVSVIFVASLQSKVAGEYQENKMAVLEQNYPNNLKEALGDYLNQAETANSLEAVLAETTEIKNAFLSWKVAPESKDIHLKAVILVSAIESLAQQGNAGEVSLKLSELKALLNDL
ncbi:MAG: hypothetical protein AAB791_01205 [Patescibacteria group bacterium]